MLWVWWGGHGVLDRSGHLRLFCADAGVEDKLASTWDSALERYAGDAVPGFADQWWLVDACETFEEALGFREPLPPDALPVGRRGTAHRQTVLRAAGRGRVAANDPVRATGLFSDVLLALLAGRSAVLPAPPMRRNCFRPCGSASPLSGRRAVLCSIPRSGCRAPNAPRSSSPRRAADRSGRPPRCCGPWTRSSPIR